MSFTHILIVSGSQYGVPRGWKDEVESKVTYQLGLESAFQFVHVSSLSSTPRFYSESESKSDAPPPCASRGEVLFPVLLRRWTKRLPAISRWKSVLDD